MLLYGFYIQHASKGFYMSPSRWCFRCNIQETMLTKHYNRLAASLHQKNTSIKDWYLFYLYFSSLGATVVATIIQVVQAEWHSLSMTFHSNQALFPNGQILQKTSIQKHLEVMWSHKLWFSLDVCVLTFISSWWQHQNTVTCVITQLTGQWKSLTILLKNRLLLLQKQ